MIYYWFRTLNVRLIRLFRTLYFLEQWLIISHSETGYWRKASTLSVTYLTWILRTSFESPRFIQKNMLWWWPIPEGIKYKRV